MMIDMTPYPAPWCDECVPQDGHFLCLGLSHCAAVQDRAARAQTARDYAVVLAHIEAHSVLRGFVFGACLSLPLWGAILALLCWVLRR
jgi:hypothetical protein